MDEYNYLAVGIGLHRINQNQTHPDSPQEKDIVLIYSQNQEEKPNRIKPLQALS
jgi:hypothetical protein